ncbi:hypothetical protein Sjap_001620 [Stephania japonica]|uniref:PWWP domain-containing protein n=1 Tax=Stephania japonica TaxID=461633 RepID=A0AAP0KMV0_9MAGN
METSSEITEPVTEQVDVFVAGEVANVDTERLLESREEYSQIDASDKEMSCVEGTSSELERGNEVAKMETSSEITEPVTEQVDVFVAGKVANVDTEKVSESREEYSQIDTSDKEMSCLEETQIDKADVAGSGESLPNGERLSANKHFLQDIKEEKASDVAEIKSSQVHGGDNMVPHIGEEKLIGEVAANENNVVLTPELLVGKTDEVVVIEAALPDDVKVSGTRSEMLESSTLIRCTTRVKNTGSLDVEESEQNVESFPEETPRRDECTSPQTVKDETVSVQVDNDGSMNTHLVEENLQEEVREIPTSMESDVSQASCLQAAGGSDSSRDFTSVGPLGNDKSNSEMEISVSYTQIGEEHKVRTELLGVDNSTLTDNSLVSDHEGASGEGTGIMNNSDTSEIGDRILEFNAVKGNPSLVNESSTLEDEALDKSTDSCLHEHSSIEENVHVDEIKLVLATEVVLSATSEVVGEGELNPPLAADSHNMEASVTVDSDAQVKVANECHESVSAAFIPGEDEFKSTQVITASDSEKDVTVSEVELAKELGLDGEGQELANESVRVEGELEITELPIKQSQQVVEQVAAKDDVSLVKDEVPVADDLDCTSPGSEKNQTLGGTAVGSAVALPNVGLSSPQNIPEKGVEQESDALGNEAVPYQACEDIKTNLYPGEENRDEGTCNVHSENEPVSAFAAESIETLEVRVTEGCTFSNPGANADDFVIDNASTKPHEQKIAESHISEFGEPQVDGTGQMVTEDLESFPEADGVLNAEDDVQKEDDITQLYEFVDTECSVPDHFDDNAVDGIKQVFPDENKDSEIAFQDVGFHQLNGEEAQCIESATLEPESDSEYCAKYLLLPEKEGEFSVSDLVWGKVKSHPWWPGQIFDPSDASEQALRYQKKDTFLVAYFGDQTFAWNDSNALKPFRMHFSQMEKQNGSETFRGGVVCALNEVKRRVEVGMACSCTPEEAFNKVKAQVIENAGIREEARVRDCVDKTLSINSFEPDKLVLYVKALGRDPCGERNRVELVVAEAQLKAFYCLKGFPLPKFHVHGGFSEADLSSSVLGGRKRLREVNESQGSSFRKRKHVWQKGSYPMKKEKGLSDLMNENDISASSSGKSEVDEKADDKSKFDAVDAISDDPSVKCRKDILSPSRDAETESHAPQSFKVGECIRRIASKLTGAPPILKGSNERLLRNSLKVDQSSEKDEFDAGSHYASEEFERRNFVASKEPEEMHSQLSLTARDPKKGVIQSSPEEQQRTSRKRKGKSQANLSLEVADPGSLSSPTFDANEQDRDGSGDLMNGKPPCKQRRRRRRSKLELHANIDSPLGSKHQNYDDEHGMLQPNHLNETPTALILNFPEVNSIPLDRNLNRIFSRFGPLKEAETEVMKDTSSARVVFKKRTDAEVACNSAAKFSIFGSTVVTYQLMYLPSAPQLKSSFD